MWPPNKVPFVATRVEPTQAPPLHTGVGDTHATGTAQCPLASQVCAVFPTQRVAAGRHSPQAPLPLQTPMPLLQTAPAAAGVVIGVVPLQAGVLQGSVASGRSLGSAMVVVPPLPSHRFLEQSCAVCDLETDPAAAGVVPHALPVQTGVTQSLLTAGH